MFLGERELLEGFRAGDEEALETVYGRCVDYATRIAIATLRACAAGSARGADEIAVAVPDVIQETFIKAFAPEARARFDASKPYEPYLAQIARNVAIDHWRQLRRYVPADVDHLIDALSLETDDASSTADWADAQTMALVNDYLASLDEESRRVHEALYVKGMSQRDAAEFLGIGRQVVRTKEAKLRRGLRRALMRSAQTPAFRLPARARKETG